MTCIDQGDFVGAIFVDFKKAFDLVDHSILLNKLSLYKIDQLSLKWFFSYLNCRKQTIISDNDASEYATNETGVPQGSILGPTLFLLSSIIYLFLSKIVMQICLQMMLRYIHIVLKVRSLKQNCKRV